MLKIALVSFTFYLNLNPNLNESRRKDEEDVKVVAKKLRKLNWTLEMVFLKEQMLLKKKSYNILSYKLSR